MKGYYKDDEKTRETIDDEGWLHTGDIGQWLENGTLQIIDRKKHIFKLAQGEYIAPEKIEGVYMRTAMVGQIFVDGNSLESFVVAIVVPDAESALSWAKKNGLAEDFKEICRREVRHMSIYMITDTHAVVNSSQHDVVMTSWK